MTRIIVQLDLGLGHLAYSTLVHAADTWPDLRKSLTTFVPDVRRTIAPEGDFGVSIRLAAATARTLTEDDAALT